MTSKLDKLKIKLKIGYDYSKFNFDKPITRDHINWEVYENKFKFVDKVRAMKKPNPKYLKIIDDDYTMRSYMFLRLNNVPIKLFAYQDIIINDKYRYKYFEAANQIGKSITLDVESVNDFIKDHNKEFNIAIISKTLPQSTHQMRRVKQFLNSMDIVDWKDDKGDSDSMSVIELAWKDDKRVNKDGSLKVKYVNRIICAPATEAALGYDLYRVFLDEFEFWEDDVYMHDQVLVPRTYGTKGNMTAMTNPNGTETKGAKLVNLKLPNGKNKYHVYNFNFLDRPGNTQDELDAASVGKTRAVIESTLLALRTKAEDTYFTIDEIKRSEWKEPNPILKMVGKQPIVFLDVGATTDQCCLVMGYIEFKEGYDELKDLKDNRPYIELFMPVIHLYPVGYPISRVIGTKSVRHNTDGWHEEKSVRTYLDEWSNDGVVPLFGCDVTGNSGLSPLFQSVNINPVDVTFSGPSKSGYWQTFKYMMEMGILHRIPHKEWVSQAKKAVAVKSARGYLLINSAGVKTGGAKAASKKKKIPDDCLDATAGLIALAADYNYVPVELVTF